MDNDQTIFQNPTASAGKNPQAKTTIEPVFSASSPQKPIPQESSAPVSPSAEPAPKAPPAERVIQEPTVAKPLPLEQQVAEPVKESLIEEPPPPLPEVPLAEPIMQQPLSAGSVSQQSVDTSSLISSSDPSRKAPTGSSGDYSGGSSFATVKRLVKVLIGLFAVLIVAALIFFVIIPTFINRSSGKVTLTYWGLWEDSNIMQGIISDFERQNPNITIDYSKQDIKQYRERLITRINNGTGPDIFRFHNSWYPMLSNVLLALPSDTISKDDFNNSFYPVAQKDLVKNGAIYGVPLEIDTLALFVNTDLFKSAGLQPPTNWNDFIDDARSLTVKDNNGQIKTAGAAMGTYANVTHASDIISLLFLQNGVELNNLGSALADRAAGALTFYTSFATDQNNVWDNSLDPSILAFSKANLAMYFGYSWDYFAIKQTNPNLSFQIVPVPQLPGQNITLASYWAEGVSVKTAHPKEALLFMKYLAQKTTEEKLYADEAKTRTFGEFYARVDLADMLKSNPLISPFISQAPNALSSFLIDQTYDNGLNQQSNTYLENAVNSILNGTSAQSAFDTFSQGISQVLQKYGQ
jgi:multiple sugar transport system substrate-binding protein